VTDRAQVLQTFHLSMSSVSHGFSFLCVDGMTAAVTGCELWARCLGGSERLKRFADGGLTSDAAKPDTAVHTLHPPSASLWDDLLLDNLCTLSGYASNDLALRLAASEGAGTGFLTLYLSANDPPPSVFYFVEGQKVVRSTCMP
jgi:hypothetical protein